MSANKISPLQGQGYTEGKYCNGFLNLNVQKIKVAVYGIVVTAKKTFRAFLRRQIFNPVIPRVNFEDMLCSSNF